MLYQAVDLTDGKKYAVGGLIGFEFAEDLGASDYNGPAFSWQTKVSLITSTLLSGAKYRVGYSYGWRYSSTARDFLGRVRIAPSTVVMNHRQEPKDGAADQIARVSGWVYLDGADASETIELQWTSQNAGDIATISEARLEIWRVQ